MNLANRKIVRTPTKLLDVNSTQANFTTPPAPSATAPTTSATVKVFGPNDWAWEDMYVALFGTDAADETLQFRLFGYKRTVGAAPLLIPTLLAEVQGVLCTATGVAATDIVNTNFFCDAYTDPNSIGNVTIFKAAANTPAMFKINYIDGFDYLGAEFSIMASSASGNGLVW